MKGLVPRVNRLNIDSKETGAGLGSLFQENTWLPEVYEAISFCVFSFSPTINNSIKDNLWKTSLWEGPKM